MKAASEILLYLFQENINSFCFYVYAFLGDVLFSLVSCLVGRAFHDIIHPYLLQYLYLDVEHSNTPLIKTSTP